MKKRDFNILKSFKKEINLSTKVVRDRTKYTRKVKHKNNTDRTNYSPICDSFLINICKLKDYVHIN